MARYKLTVGDTHDSSHTQSLPNELLQLFFQHAQDVVGWCCIAKPKGALAIANNQWRLANF